MVGWATHLFGYNLTVTESPAFITKVDIGAHGTVLELIDDLLSVEFV